MDKPFYIDGKEFKSIVGLVDFDNLKFDIEARTDLQKCKNQAEAYKQIISDPSTFKLANKIVKDGSIHSSLFARQGQEKDEFLVFDGCRRLAAFKYLLKNENKITIQRKVPVRLILDIDKDSVKKIIEEVMIVSDRSLPWPIITKLKYIGSLLLRLELKEAFNLIRKSFP